MSLDKNKMFVIADDLTGANDTGVQFARRGFSTQVLLEGTSVMQAGESAVMVLDTDSRSICSEAAYEKVQAAAIQAKQSGFAYYYKKIDSTLRGNVGKEIKAILDLKIHDFALVMPAFLKNGRTTVGGHHLLNGVPLAATEIARDPKCPVRESVLPELLRQQTGLAVGHIGILEILAGQQGIAAAIRRYLGAGCTIISADCWAEEHFFIVAAAVASLSGNVLWTGSAGLAEVLPEILGWRKKESSLPVLVLAGSVSRVTREQVRQLIDAGYSWLDMDIASCLPWQKGKKLAALEQAQERLKQGKNVVITSGFAPESVEEAVRKGSEFGLSAIDVSRVTAEILGFLGAEILKSQSVAGAILTGGDTAVSVCQSLGVTGIAIIEEVAPAIPLGTVTLPTGKVLKIITKAGAFGEADALVKAGNFLLQRS